MSAMEAARRLLEVASQALVDGGRPIPDRVLVAPGAETSWDVEQLVVLVRRPAVPGTPAREPRSARPCPGPRVAELVLQLVRCVAVDDGDGGPPGVADAEADAEGLLDDAEALAHALTPAAVVGRSGVPASVSPVELLGPQGGMAAVSLVVQVPL